MNVILKKLEDWGASPEEAISVRMMDDEALYMKLLKNLAAGDHAEGFCCAVEESRLEDAYFEIHHLKGSAGILGLIPLFQSAERIIRCLSEEDMKSLPKETDYFRELFQEFRKIVKNSQGEA